MQTATNWLIQELQLFYLNRSKLTYNEILEQAKEIEKQQILDAFEEGSSDGYDGWGSTNKEKYYNETYGSKGSDEDLIDAINMARNEPDMSGDDIILSIKQSKSTSSQTEISDEEIDKIPLEDALKFTEWMSSLINSNYKSGGNWYYKGEIVTTKKLYEKWYREQLKKH